jgi:peptidoglycan/LPS O-acetylase OafA/YrhL/lysophospholipase L1-like esterase
MNAQNSDSMTTPVSPSGDFGRGPIVPYVPGLDGLRALAVIAVIVYHANKQWLGGGFLGVEVFFVISGYLITLLLIAERERTGTVSFGQFWFRRARRLLPALFTMLIALVTYVAFFERDYLGTLRGDVIAGVSYVANWFQIWTGSSYTSASEFAPLRHLWSLAVEEQFYIVWPVIMFVLLHRVRGRAIAIFGGVFLAGAIAISVYTAVMYIPGNLSDASQTMSLFGREVQRTDFLYLGTLSRSSGLLLGAALATVWQPWAIRRGTGAKNANALDLAGVLSVVALAFMSVQFKEVVLVQDVGSQGYDLLYQGGFALVGVATLVAIATVTHPRSRLGRYVLGSTILVWIGRRSYGLYLYHWVIFQAYRQDTKQLGTPLGVVECVALVALSLILSEISYRFVETPIRKGQLSAAWRLWRTRQGALRGPLPIAVAAIAVVPVFAIVSMAGATVNKNDVQQSLDDNQGAVVTAPVTATTEPTTATTVAPPTTQPVQKFDVFALGDSVMLGSAKKLSAQGIVVDATKSRQVREGLQVINYYTSIRQLGDNVVIHLGTNGSTTTETFHQLMGPMADVERVVVLTVRVPGRPYEQNNNAIINALPARFPNVTVVDWFTLSDGKKDWFARDGIHLNGVGQDAYVSAILSALGRTPVAPPTTTDTTTP